MVNRVFQIKITDWVSFLEDMYREYDIYAPQSFEDKLYFEFLDKSDIKNISYRDIAYRTVQPIKIFFLPVGETVSNTSNSEEIDKNYKKKILVGLKACDLNALSILDEVYLDEDFIDPFYKHRREDTIIISSDCTDPLESCFCTEVDSQPYPVKNFDLNLSLVDNYILIEVGSEKGQKLIDEYGKDYFKEANNGLIDKREQNREKIKSKVEEINTEFATKDSYDLILKGNYESEIWEELAEDCVECGGCTNICPTCHCFILVDGAKGEEFFKNKYWDSCQLDDFTKMAAGEDPRDEIWKRFRNRYFCKYNYKLDNFNIIACTGCGRCIEACQGDIDKREVLKKVSETKKNKKTNREEVN
ncbi:MAG: hypothetical protein FXF47_02315 [Candidatus Mcinerneyibacterium aminivorans]|uniref:4Fe-4S ferredoxin-type domain-containing protein n=1 Tax=Candidatus Mcinerneyibacterium aminivorans TaxID=2703815 RepID=A0A5D0MJD7_9BACT|nr:MAG: hypothetical protein FXF47_02315 [Candidatus Mcinerneyibacterium aminivorans]